jgi:hypothetical protein
VVGYYHQYPLARRIDPPGRGFDNLGDLQIAETSVALSGTNYGHGLDAPWRMRKFAPYSTE